MRIHVYRSEEGQPMFVLVEASPGAGKAPVILNDITRENIKAMVLPVVNEMRAPKRPSQS